MPRSLAFALALLPLLWSGAAAAHADDAVAPGAVWQSWTFDPLVLVPIFLAHWLYGRGWLRLPPRLRKNWMIVSFAAGEIVLFVALVSPIDALGETLLSFHMVQHMLLVAIAPPLLLIGRPALAFGHALPAGTLAAAARKAPLNALMRGGVWLSTLVPATVLHGIALWAWHAPMPFQAALEHDWVHSLEHASFFGTALLFWIALLRAGRTARTALQGALAAFVTFVHSGMLGGLLTLAGRPLYPAYGDRPLLWGLDLLADQQLAGVLMWVPIGPVYLIVALWLATRVLRPAPDIPLRRRETA